MRIGAAQAVVYRLSSDVIHRGRAGPSERASENERVRESKTDARLFNFGLSTLRIFHSYLVYTCRRDNCVFPNARDRAPMNKLSASTRCDAQFSDCVAATVRQLHRVIIGIRYRVTRVSRAQLESTFCSSAFKISTRKPWADPCFTRSSPRRARVPKARRARFALQTYQYISLFLSDTRLITIALSSFVYRHYYSQLMRTIIIFIA